MTGVLAGVVVVVYLWTERDHRARLEHPGKGQNQTAKIRIRNDILMKLHCRYGGGAGFQEDGHPGLVLLEI